MKKSYIIIGSIVFILFVILMSYRSTYNKAVKLQQTVNEAWGDVATTYQRRADLVPQLVATVKGAAKNEKEILVKVTQARSGLVGVNEDLLNAKNPQQMEMLGKKINTAINLAFEAYPQVRATDNFTALQAQLEGTENRINKARQDYNYAVKEYNSHILGFFNSMFLNASRFPEKEPFKAAAGSEVAPTVNFEE